MGAPNIKRFFYQEIEKVLTNPKFIQTRLRSINNNLMSS